MQWHHYFIAIGVAVDLYEKFKGRKKTLALVLTDPATLNADNSRHCGIFFKHLNLPYIAVFYRSADT